MNCLLFKSVYFFSYFVYNKFLSILPGAKNGVRECSTRERHFDSRNITLYPQISSVCIKSVVNKNTSSESQVETEQLKQEEYDVVPNNKRPSSLSRGRDSFTSSQEYEGTECEENNGPGKESRHKKRPQVSPSHQSTRPKIVVEMPPLRCKPEAQGSGRRRRSTIKQRKSRKNSQSRGESRGRKSKSKSKSRKDSRSTRGSTSKSRRASTTRKSRHR